MSENESQDAVMSLLHDEFYRERENDFAILRRIPSTSQRKFLDYFFSLTETQKDAISEAFIQRALFHLFPSAPHPYQSGNAAYRQFVDAMPLIWDWKYEGVRMLRIMLAAAESDSNSPFASCMTTEIKEMILAIKPVKSTEIRKVVKLALSQLLDPITITHEGGDWYYRGLYYNNEVRVHIDYGGRSDQLRYEVSVSNNERAIVLNRFSFEHLMGFPLADWDCLEQSNLDQSIALLKELIVHCIEVSRQLPVGYKQQEYI